MLFIISFILSSLLKKTPLIRYQIYLLPWNVKSFSPRTIECQSKSPYLLGVSILCLKLFTFYDSTPMAFNVEILLCRFYVLHPDILLFSFAFYIRFQQVNNFKKIDAKTTKFLYNSIITTYLGIVGFKI